jgi:uncharacterized alpha/beta hydrolase family protein
MNKKYISITIILIIILIILSELHTSRTNQQLQNDRYEAEEKLKNSKERLLKEHTSRKSI